MTADLESKEETLAPPKQQDNSSSGDASPGCESLIKESSSSEDRLSPSFPQVTSGSSSSTSLSSNESDNRVKDELEESPQFEESSKSGENVGLTNLSAINVTYLGYNPSSNTLAIGTSDGTYFLFNSSHQLIHTQRNCGGPIVFVETLVQSTLVATVNASPLQFDLDVISDTQPKEPSSREPPEKSVEKEEDASKPSSDQAEFQSPKSRSDDTPPKSTDESAEEEIYGCRSVQLWNTQKSSRIAVIKFPAPSPVCIPGLGRNSSVVPQVTFIKSDDANETSSSAETATGTLTSSNGTSSVPLNHSKSFSSSDSVCFEPICAVKLSHRRLVVFLDCPSCEIDIFDLKTLKLIHRLERNVITVNRIPLYMSIPIPLGELLRIGFIKNKSYFGVCPTRSLAGVGALSLHPCLGYLAVPVAVPAVDASALETNPTSRLLSFFKPGKATTSASSGVGAGSFPVSDESMVASLSKAGAYKNSLELGFVALIDLLGSEVNVIASIKVSEHPLTNLSINSSSTMMVTSSIKGTLFRVWSLPSLDQIFCFRRGSRWAQVMQLSFTLDSSYLFATSRVRNQDIAQILSVTPAKRSSGFTSLIAKHGHETLLQENKITMHLFQCAKQLTVQQRQRHAAPHFVRQEIQRGDDLSEASATPTKIGLGLNTGPFLSSRPSSKSERRQQQTEPRRLSFWQEKVNDLSHVLKSAKGTAKSQLNQVLNEVIAPHLPSSIRESVINAQKHFAVAYLKQSPIALGIEVPLACVAVVEENNINNTIKISMFSQTGSAATFQCDQTKGGEAK